MQLPVDEELVMVAGHPPLRARKLRFYADRNFTSRVLPPPVLSNDGYADRPGLQSDDWGGQVIAAPEPAEFEAMTLLGDAVRWLPGDDRSEEHTSELQSLMRTSYAVFCLKKKKHLSSTYIFYANNLHTRNLP